MIEPLLQGYAVLQSIMDALPLPINAFYSIVLVLVVVCSVLRMAWTLRG